MRQLWILPACKRPEARAHSKQFIMPETLSYICPFCAREVRVGGPCPGCEKKSPKPGKKSWAQDKSADGLDLPADDFDYDAFIAREFGKSPHRALGIKWYWWLLGVAVLSGMIIGVFWRR